MWKLFKNVGSMIMPPSKMTSFAEDAENENLRTTIKHCIIYYCLHACSNTLCYYSMHEKNRLCYYCMHAVIHYVIIPCMKKIDYVLLHACSNTLCYYSMHEKNRLCYYCMHAEIHYVIIPCMKKIDYAIIACMQLYIMLLFHAWKKLIML